MQFARTITLFLASTALMAPAAMAQDADTAAATTQAAQAAPATQETAQPATQPAANDAAATAASAPAPVAAAVDANDPAQVSKFARALSKVNAINADATTDQAAKQPQMVAAIEAEGLDPNAFNELAQVYSADEAFRTKVNQEISSAQN
ncbi:MAG: hypothetical protein WCZ66_01295 [Sphingomonadaceae bacterium]